MKKAELNEYKKRLIDRKIELLADLKHISEDSLKKSLRDASGDLSGYSFHMADVGTENYQREINLGIATSEQKELYEIDDALHRIKAGTYGICERCKKNIPKKRLNVVLHARYCIKCQEEEEEEKE